MEPASEAPNPEGAPLVAEGDQVQPNAAALTSQEENGFWGWWGGVKEAVAPKLTQVANVLDDVGSSVR